MTSIDYLFLALTFLVVVCAVAILKHFVLI